MSFFACFRALLALGLLAATRPAAAQAPAVPATKIKVYLVGTFHFNASATDVIKGTKVDMSTPDKQRELDELVSKLQKTQADKVLVEWMPRLRQRFVDSTYALYRQGQRPVGNPRDNNNEVVQLGYRLANKLNRNRVYCADADGEFDYPTAQQYAKTHHQEGALTNRYSETQLPDSMGRLLAARIKAIRATQAPAIKYAGERLLVQFQRMNTEPTTLSSMDGYLLDQARVGGGEEYPGADLAGEFFKRNVRIYSNLLRTVDVQHDKAIVLIIGQGHIAFLKSILKYNSLFEVADVLPLLEAK
ncbi:hypothetical protein GO988_09340 [Hymenobacter sp. HMF4947]|uniref:TraB/GumN family protein n=1 Tax=Hymenobacter ginkgonis TaxID=2682976 RepID=A0A7K1TDN8_9BACT|nr:DUF5694 domain-containing protein [Hymenobacter ginkgonis]MVN76525.1 hypothetical protein [Hymenobacter ginkgonis]